MNGSKAKAVELLDHYIVRVMEKAGLKPDSDTHAELAELVDHLIDAAVEEGEKRRNLKNAQKRIANDAKLKARKETV